MINAGFPELIQLKDVTSTITDYALSITTESAIVSIEIYWSGFDKLDSTITVIQKHGEYTSTWIELSEMTHTLNSASGSREFVLSSFTSTNLGLRYNKGTNSSGTLSCHVLFKKNTGATLTGSFALTDQIKFWPSINSCINYPRIHPTGGLQLIQAIGTFIPLTPPARSVVYQVVAECWNSNGGQSYDIPIAQRTVNGFWVYPTENANFLFHIIEF